MNAENFNDFLNIFTHKESANGKDKKIILPKMNEIDKFSIANKASLISVIIPDGVTSIWDHTFAHCNSLTSVTIPDSVTSIGSYAFEYCGSLTNVTIPDSVTTIGGCVFYDCESLTSIAIPKSVTTIGGRAFEGCTSLTNINVSEGNNNFCSIDGVLFNKEQTKIICYPPKKPGESYTIPNSITSVADLAFSRCESLTNIIISNGVTRIGWGTFFGCKSLKSVTIPDSVAYIGNNAFNACSSSLTIYGKSGSYAEEYAKNNNFKFKGSLKE